MSEQLIKLSKPIRKLMFESRKWKTNMEKIKGISTLKLKDIGIRFVVKLSIVPNYPTDRLNFIFVDKHVRTY